jgi:hypothetical protein
MIVRTAATAAALLLTLASRTLTPDGADTYTHTTTATTITIAAPITNTGGNLRRVYWPSGQTDHTDTTVCATWGEHTADSTQPGTAHHITSTRAVTVTRNVVYQIYWVFNVHIWDGQTFTQIAQFDMTDVVVLSGGVYRPAPWRVCTRTTGPTLTFKIWFPPEAEPTWSDPVRTRSTTIPAGWNLRGKAGWYAGHLPPGGTLTYTNPTVSAP